MALSNCYVEEGDNNYFDAARDQTKRRSTFLPPPRPADPNLCTADQDAP